MTLDVVRFVESLSLGSRHSCAHFSFSRSKLLSLVSDFYHAAFNQQKTGKDYMKQRGLVDPALFSRFKVGFCSGDIRESMPRDDQKTAELKELGVLTENDRSFSQTVLFSRSRIIPEKL